MDYLAVCIDAVMCVKRYIHPSIHSFDQTQSEPGLGLETRRVEPWFEGFFFPRSLGELFSDVFGGLIWEGEGEGEGERVGGR